jgi:hypothetical protein
MEVQLHLFLTSMLDGVIGRSASCRSDGFTPHKGALVRSLVGIQISSRAELDALEEGEISCQCWKSSQFLGRTAHNLIITPT